MQVNLSERWGLRYDGSFLHVQFPSVERYVLSFYLDIRDPQTSSYRSPYRNQTHDSNIIPLSKVTEYPRILEEHKQYTPCPSATQRTRCNVSLHKPFLWPALPPL